VEKLVARDIYSRHQHTAEENLDRCRQKRRVYLLYLVLQLSLLLLANFNSSWVITH